MSAADAVGGGLMSAADAVGGGFMSAADVVGGGIGHQTDTRGQGIDPVTGEITTRTIGYVDIPQHDTLIPVPDSGVAAALGFARETGIPYEMGLIRSHYVGRTFIEPQQQIRHFGVRLKLHPVRELLAGKRIAVVDDSIVRGTTSRKIVKMLRDAGAAEVHLRISSPPTSWPCFYGIDTPTREELIASRHTPEEIARYVTADSLGYLSVEGLRDAVGGGDGFCDACFSGEYPVPVELPKVEGRRQLPLVGV